MARTCLIALALALGPGSGLALAGCGGDDASVASTKTTTTTETATTETATPETTSTETTTTAPTQADSTVRVVVRGGRVKGGIQRVTVKKGDRVVLVVQSDVADQLHVHGYDVTKDVAAGGTVRIRFPTMIPGRFEVELENLGLQVADITVKP